MKGFKNIKVKLRKVPENQLLEIAKLRLRKDPRVENNPLGIYDYYHPFINSNYKPPVKSEMSELTGKLDQVKHFISEEYKKFLVNLNKTNNKYIASQSQNQRLVANKNYLKLFEDFIYKNELFEEHDKNRNKEVEEKYFELLHKIFYRVKPSHAKSLPSDEFLKMHYEFAVDSSKPKFEIPINRYNFAMMVHPYWGYFGKFPVSVNLI